jgi:type II secretory pathway component GspD/PulD (secretin)
MATHVTASSRVDRPFPRAAFVAAALAALASGARHASGASPCAPQAAPPAAAPAPQSPPSSGAPAPAADPAASPATEPRSAVWGAPGANAAQGGVSTPLTGPGGRPPAPDAPPAPPAAEAAPPPPAKQAARVDMTTEGRFSLSAQGIEVGKLLELISIKARQNIVASDKVKGLVTVNLFDVPLEDALNAILDVNGLAWRREGDFIYVNTKAEVEAQRVREARIITLQFLSAEDAIAFIKPVLTEGGTAVALGKVDQGYAPTVENGGADSFAFAAKVMVNDYPEVHDRVAKVVGELDTPPKQVRVEATILTVDLTDDTAFGLDLSVVGNVDFGSITGGPLEVVNDMIGGDVAQTPSTGNVSNLFPTSTNNAITPTAQVGVLTNDVAIFLQMLDQVVNSSVLARPTVTVLNRQRAQVQIGERIAYLSTTQTQTSTTQEVKYLDVGVKLIFRPFVSPDGMVRIELAPQVSTARSKTIAVAPNGFAEVPDEFTQELRTNVRVKSGQTIVLGGLFREDESVTKRQVPGLGDLIPGVFSGAAGTTRKQEVMFLITPTIVDDSQDYRAGDEALRAVEAAKVGARAGLLPFSHAHLAGNYEVQALEAWRKGDRTTALFYVDQALRNERASPTMISLREAIRTDRRDQYRTELDSLDLLDPRQREPFNGVPLNDTFRYSPGWVTPPRPEDLAKDVPPPVDDDYDPYDPLPVAEPVPAPEPPPAAPPATPPAARKEATP